MQMIFVSSVAEGGSGASQRQLARRLAERGHGVELLAAASGRRIVRSLYERQVDLSTRLRDNPLRPALLSVQRRMGQRVRTVGTPDHPTWTAVVPENAYRTLRRRVRPDVVIASSIDRVTWRRLRAQLEADGVPSVLYIREASGLGHLTVSGAAPDLLLANAESHAVRARDAGYPCEVVPSVVEIDQALVETSRKVVLLINPMHLLGGDRLWPIAEARPDIPFVVQESGLLSAAERDEVLCRAHDHPNVSVRSFSARPADVYRDARILVVPHRVDNRPRVVLEAQANGIPVIASGYPGLVESVGRGGIIVEDADDPLAWVHAVGDVWDDAIRYDTLARAARDHAGRADVSPSAVVDRFESLISALVETHTPEVLAEECERPNP